ncbi:hypothetical protein JAAARDRAFT_41903 [Jaapia argillacea MUCL 33604]|uniref:Prefoldin subunit 3 n=1 Tax=Jaapia argillacea MUCL 33604 TaxID=933084 RepID=A0A067PHT0_9AGAM|nr:hypothetical protein JAAARDRAFT_41903 [Jaapia argillacea MUCL 33604]
MSKVSKVSKDIPKDLLANEEKNPRGIPKAPFIANVEEYIGGPDTDVAPTLTSIQEALAKYRYMDSNLTSRRSSLEDKIPDIKKTLDMVKFLLERREAKGKSKQDDDDLDDDDEEEEDEGNMKTMFELNETLYAEAELEDTDEVYLWLGANTALAYPLSSAETLLSSKLSTAQRTLSDTQEDLEWLREQMTVMEVNTARVYNWDVKRRRERGLSSGGRAVSGS